MKIRSPSRASSTLLLRYLVPTVIVICILLSILNIAEFKPPNFPTITFESSDPPAPTTDWNTPPQYNDNDDAKFVFTNPFAHPVPEKQTVLVLTLVRNNESWGGKRNFFDFVKLVQGFDYPMSNIHLGVLVSDKQEFDAIISSIQKRPLKDFFGTVHVILRTKDVGIAREDRKADEAQRQRRRLLARLRNFLLFTTLREEESVLWIDSDMISIPKDLLGRMVDSGKDIITTPTKLGPNGGFYDYNAWVGERNKPTAEEQANIEQGGMFIPGAKSVKLTHELEGEFGELDSVGGTVLFVRGEVHREGVAFTTNYVIGSGWDYEGYDGIETEGLCYVAKFLGYKCWGMPHSIAVHSED
ncbi:MAG: Anp1-domain-containing protein [Linnemannia gamsii]|nr:MAG: Anp1-domain-containing protein [Linnemannia gamsii]